MEPDKKSNGALVGLIIIILILVVGGIYMWQTNADKVKRIEDPTPQSETTADEDTNELDLLDADLQATDSDAGVDVNTVN